MGIGNRRKAIRTNLLRVVWPNEEGYIEEELKFRSPGTDPLRSASDMLYTTIEGEIEYNQFAHFSPDMGTHVVIEYEGDETPEDSESIFPVTSQIIKLVPLPPGEGDWPIFDRGVFQPGKWAEEISRIKEDILPPERFVGSTIPTSRVRASSNLFQPIESRPTNMVLVLDEYSGEIKMLLFSMIRRLSITPLISTKKRQVLISTMW